MLARPEEPSLSKQDNPMGFAIWWDFLRRPKLLNSSGKRKEMFSGALSLELFCPDGQWWVTRWPLGDPNEVAQCFLLERRLASSESIHVIPAKRRTERDVDSCCRLRASTHKNKHRGCLCSCFPNGRMSTVPAGHVSLVLAQCIRREIYFLLV